MDRRGVEESGEGEGGGGAWTYLDDMNVPQGPFKSSEVVTWINSGHFDGRGSALFRREFEDASYRPLNECLSKLMQDEFKEARRRVANIHQTSTQNVAKEGLRDSTDGSEKKFGTDALNQLPITRERGFGQSVFDLGMMGSASNKPLDSEMLDWTSDIDIVLVPSKVLWQIEAQRFNPRRRSLQIGPLGALAKEEPVRGGCPIETFSALVDRPSRLVVSKLTAADADRDKQDLLLDSEEAVWRDEVKIPSRIIIVPAHSSLLKSASPLLLREIIKLEEQIRRATAEQRKAAVEDGTFGGDTATNSWRCELIIGCQNPEALKLIIRCIYGHVDDLSRADTLLLPFVMRDAAKLRLPRIVHRCLDALSRPLDVATLVKLLILADGLNLTQVALDCLSMLAECAFGVFSGGVYQSLSSRAWKALLCRDNLMLDEIQIYALLNLWMHGQLLKATRSKRRVSEAEGARMKMLKGFFALSGTETTESSDDVKINLSRGSVLEPPGTVPVVVRFDSMSVDQIKSIRPADNSLDTPLFDALLRYCTSRATRPRVHPWKASNSYKVDFEGGLFPVKLTRVEELPERGMRKLGAFMNPDRDEEEDESTTYGLPGGGSRFVKWSAGDPRWISEALWAFQVKSIMRGHLMIGVCSPATAATGFTPSSRVGEVTTWHFNSKTRNFSTGTTTEVSSSTSGNTLHQVVVSRRTRTWNRRLRRGDLILLRLSVGASCLNMSLGVLAADERRYMASAAPVMKASHGFSVATASKEQVSEAALINPSNMATNSRRAAGARSAKFRKASYGGATHFSLPVGGENQWTAAAAGEDGGRDESVLETGSLSRQWLLVRPWVALMDDGDSLSIPEPCDAELIRDWI